MSKDQQALVDEAKLRLSTPKRDLKTYRIDLCDSLVKLRVLPNRPDVRVLRRRLESTIIEIDTVLERIGNR